MSTRLHQKPLQVVLKIFFQSSYQIIKQAFLKAGVSVRIFVCWAVSSNIQQEKTGGEETRSGTEKRCSYNLQRGYPAWWSADNCSIFPTVNDLDFLEVRSETAEEIRNA